MLAPREPIVLVCDDADAADAIRDMLTARAILLELADATCATELPAERRPAPAIITGTHTAEVLEHLGVTPTNLSALGVEVRVAAANPTTFYGDRLTSEHAVTEGAGAARPRAGENVTPEVRG